MTNIKNKEIIWHIAVTYILKEKSEYTKIRKNWVVWRSSWHFLQLHWEAKLKCDIWINE